ncbi:MAG: aromatic amino acid hydroxylase [Bacteroidetes bacterium]|nr:aromatic amino acid hydroxylase [Bacteroidota bacterium]
MESNNVLDRLPKHLMDLVIEQPYNEYTSQDHALWRYVMRQNVRYLSRVAHGSYVDGLKRTGISIEQIPHMYGMNRILKEIGWAAVAVDGFIPPSAFMEFQAYNVLVIAADIRPIYQIEYTPAPDILHEAAGHAPIIANDEYAEYLRLFGEIGRKAFSSAHDYKVYEAIRHLSILKADPYTQKAEIDKAELELSELEKLEVEPSEMCKIRNMHWWTVEYGLIGDLKNPKIYGAGLLSSIGESYNCLQDHVKKLPYDLNAKDVGFDITTQQPQLFVSPDFEHLTHVLNDFADQMALKTGGEEGIVKAINSDNIATCVYSSGLQISGRFTNYKSRNGQICWVKTEGPSSLNYDQKEILGHDKSYHSHGFSSPVGKLKNVIRPLEFMTEEDLASTGIKKGRNSVLEFESGLMVKGKLENIHQQDQRIMILSFTDCQVTFEGEILFDPAWGTYDMAVGEKIISAFPGPADPIAWELKYLAPKEKTHKIKHTTEAIKLHELYTQVRNVREGEYDYYTLDSTWMELKTKYPNEWLLPLEILEILTKNNDNSLIRTEIGSFLKMKQEEKNFSNLIANGLLMLND